MERFRTRKDEIITQITVIVIGIVINVLLSYLVYIYKLPLFLDTLGTTVVALLGGPFVGVVVGMTSNLICLAFNDVAIYFGFLNALTAVFVS